MRGWFLDLSSRYALWRSLLVRAWRSLHERGPRATLDHIRHRFALMRRPAEATRRWAKPTFDPTRSAPPHRTIRTSIVIPCYGQWDLVRSCLAAVLSSVDLADTEIVLVDDASPTAPPPDIRNCPALRYMRCEENLGFIGASNLGAAQAGGEWLCFLNSDTEVQPGWLQALHRTFETFPDTGMACARLFYPDGRQQEAGGIVFADGSAWNYGKGGDAASPDFRFVRECDYGSGACLLIPKPLFDGIGGFQSMYRPAYFEDTDLAMRVREAGRVVRYQPASEVVHVEGATAGTDIAQGPKAAQVRNQQVFAEQWLRQLACHPKTGDVFVDANRCATWRARKRVLWVDTLPPEPRRDAGSLRLVGLLSSLVLEGVAVDFHAFEATLDDAAIDALGAVGVRASGINHHPSAAALLKQQGRQYDAVVISRHHAFDAWAGLVRRHAPEAKLILDTVDLHGLREMREAQLSGSNAAIASAQATWDHELASMRQTDEVWVVSDAESDLLAIEALPCPVRRLSNPHPLRTDTPGFEARDAFLFVANFKHGPNADGLAWFIEQVWPLLRTGMPNARLDVVGAHASEDLRERMRTAGVGYLGPVDALEPVLDAHRVNLAPLRYGAGVKGKITQALSIGLPVVTTRIGAEGIPEAALAMQVHDDAEGFAMAMQRLHEDRTLWLACREHGYRVAQAHFSLDAARSALREAFRL